ncbi:MAG: hypothetical protein F9K23_17680 [Bacteroidetes bacterium]|nr:MAG: hypothetical protein F9K23_17680 [Bacteroidota bacterium]
MKNIKNLVYCLMAACMLLSACKKEDDAKPSAGEPAWAPGKWFKANNQKVFDFIYNNNVIDSFVMNVQKADSGVYEIRSWDKTMSQTAFQFFDGGYLKSFNTGQTKLNATRIAKIGAKQGDTWKDFNGTDTVQCTIKNTGVQVTVLAGSFTCTEMEMRYIKSGNVLTFYSNDEFSVIKIVTGTARYELRQTNF